MSDNSRNIYSSLEKGMMGSGTFASEDPEPDPECIPNPDFKSWKDFF